MSADLLQVHELANLRMDKDVMATARPPQLGAERLHHLRMSEKETFATSP